MAATQILRETGLSPQKQGTQIHDLLRTLGWPRPGLPHPPKQLEEPRILCPLLEDAF